MSSQDHDAFSFLMRSSSLLSQQSTARRKSKSKPHFVLCPAGCGKHITEANIHWHLDQCIPLQSQRQEDGDADSQESAIHSQLAPLGDEDEPTLTLHSEGQDEKIAELSNQLKIEKSPSPSSLHPTSRDSALNEEPDQIIATEEVLLASDNPLKRKITPEALSKQRKTKVTKEEGFLDAINDDAISKPNAFSLMMDQSRKIFSQPTSSSSDPCVFFCLTNTEGHVSLSTKRPPRHLAWQKIVRVTERIHGNPQSHYIALCSTIPIQGGTTGDNDFDRMYAGQITKDTTVGSHRRWVRHHSRLSVSVLKSMLQKSIRRRKPLPAVRLAMELADKALGELLRRLPIIVLEDSTLCGNYPFLVWMMMTHAALQTGGDESDASGPILPDSLIERVLETVFQVASCRLQDSLSFSHDSEHGNDTVSISSLLRQFKEDERKRVDEAAMDHDEHNNTSSGSSQEPAPQCLLPLTILIRASYGGMKGDIVMLNQYSNVWYRRMFGSRNESADDSSPRTQGLLCNMPSSVGELLHNNETSEPSQNSRSPWLKVPSLLHDSALEKIDMLVRPLLKSGLDRLNIEDACLEGVDFHCSDVLDSLIQNPEIGGVALDLLCINLPEKRREVIQTILGNSWRKFMWDTLSGVNHRRPLNNDMGKATPSESEEGLDSTKALLERIWNELVKSEVRSYQLDYVRKRLHYEPQVTQSTHSRD